MIFEKVARSRAVALFSHSVSQRGVVTIEAFFLLPFKNTNRIEDFQLKKGRIKKQERTNKTIKLLMYYSIFFFGGCFLFIKCSVVVFSGSNMILKQKKIGVDLKLNSKLDVIFQYYYVKLFK